MAAPPFHYPFPCDFIESHFSKSSQNKSKSKGVFLSDIATPKKRIKLKQSRVNLYPKQHELLKKLASENGTNVSEYIRQKLNLNIAENQARKEYKEHEKVIEKTINPKLDYHLAKIGNNLNQITKKINSKKYVPNIEVLQILVKIEKAFEDIKKMK